MTKHYTLSACLILNTFFIYAQPGAPELNFNGSGYVLTSIPGKVNTGFEAGLAQADGKIIAVGGTDEFANYPYNSDALIVRYNPDGSADATFGTSGKTVTDIELTNDRFWGVALQPDGKIVAAGRAQTMGDSRADCMVVRYNPDGSLDNTFGNDGKLRITFTYYDDELNAVAIQPDGRIVIVGTYRDEGADLLVARLNSDGSQDLSFGDHGKVLIDFNSSIDIGISVALQPDGKILAVGNTYGGGGSDMAVARLNTDGSFDAGFGSNGKVTVDIYGSDDDFGHSVALQASRIILSGWAILPGVSDRKYCMALAALNADGTPDISFGDNGIDTTDFGISHDFFYEGISRGNKIIAAGGASQDAVQTSNENYDFAIAAYKSDGTADQNFGTAGKVNSNFSGTSGLVSADQAKDLFYYNNTLYAVGSAAHFTGEWDFTSYGVVAAYQLEPVAACFVDAISGLTATPSLLWPPNHKMKEVTLSYTLSGNCPDVTIIVTSNDPQGNESDWRVIDDHHVLLRAERNGNGRIYTITVLGTSASGTSVSASVNVTVPKSPAHSPTLADDAREGRLANESFNARILSNPSRTDFMLNIESTKKDPVEITVYDISGKVMESWRGNLNGPGYQFGDLYRPGTYIVDVIQNTQRRNLKVVKIK